MTARRLHAGAAELITLQDGARLLGMSPATLRRWGSEGRITIYKVGSRRIRVDRAEVVAMARVMPTAAVDRSRSMGA